MKNKVVVTIADRDYTMVAVEDENYVRKCAAHVDQQLREIANIYKAKIIDLSIGSMVMELTGEPEKIDGFLDVLSPYKILEMCRTGITALERGGVHRHA